MMSLAIAGTYWYQSSASVCPVPLAYRVGTIDESFSLSITDAQEYIAEAEALWEGSVNRELFVYDETAEFTVNFIFDERQETANSEADLRETLDEQWLQNETVLKTIESLQTNYESLSATYKARVTEYEKQLTPREPACVPTSPVIPWIFTIAFFSSSFSSFLT